MSSTPSPTSSPPPFPPTPSNSPPPVPSTAPLPSTPASPPPQPVSSPPPPADATSPSSSSPSPSGATPSFPAPPRKPLPSSPPPPGRSSGSGGGRPASPGSHPSSPSTSSSVSAAFVVGLAVGGVVILLVLSIICICCFKKKRRPRPLPLSPHPLHHFHDAQPQPPPVKDHPYGLHQNWQNVPPPAIEVFKIPPNPPLPPFAPRPPNPSGHFGPPPSQPPPPLTTNSEGPGSSYSGSENPPLSLSPGISFGFSKRTFTYEELVLATDGFSDANFLGQGGFGYVHRGMLPNGKEVAIKQMKAGSGQGEREFQAEVEIVSRVHHKHLVSLVGYCIAEGKRLLVYEFVPNNTLEFHLHSKGRSALDWPTRLKIALGSAKGLAYLHEDCHPKIIHRDIKASNILLDFKFEAKVADFGLAKIALETNTHVSTRVMGTFGYLAPEYASTGKLTDKSDVFSFGVMLLELTTGRRPYDSNQSFMDDSLVDWARPLLACALDDGNFDTLVDPHLSNGYNPIEMRRVIACAAVSVRHSAKRRPRMSQIVRALEGDASLEDLNEGVKPGQSSVYASHESSDYDAMQYNEDMKKFRKIAFSSQEYGNSGYSAPTSEYGLFPSASSSEEQRTREMGMDAVKKES